MGAWGTGNLENDDGADWMDDLVESVNPHLISETLKAIVELKPNEYLYAAQSFRALAAAEIVAAIRGRPAEDLPEKVSHWLDQNRDRVNSNDLSGLALKAIQRIESSSEVRDLHQESGSTSSWLAVIRDIRARLQEG